MGAKTFTLEQVTAVMDENGGFCTECGAEAYGVEPDAHDYRCEECGAYAVQGAEEILLLGLAH